MLVKEAGVPGPDALGDILPAPPAPELFVYQRDRGRGVEEIKPALGTLAERTLAAS
ncbi:hypothetical protein [Streptomyces sp. NBC_00046]|uniref:hypothetical protein n=1 Tax=unclassified Streptomyces TaxID=2593676 RepID=UPI003251BFFC